MTCAVTSLNSEVGTVRRLGEAALQAGRVHNVILMVDLGDLREGVTAEQAPETALEMDRTPGIRLAGIGVNLACYGGVIPTVQTMELLLEVKCRWSSASAGSWSASPGDVGQPEKWSWSARFHPASRS